MTHVNNTAIVAVLGGARTIRNYAKQALNPGVYFSYINNFLHLILMSQTFGQKKILVDVSIILDDTLALGSYIRNPTFSVTTPSSNIYSLYVYLKS
jgi:hypothetical protein